MNIGQWVRRRYHDGVHVSKWHLVESVVDDEPVTRCGRRLAKRVDATFAVSDVMPLTRMIGQPQLCKVCE